MDWFDDLLKNFQDDKGKYDIDKILGLGQTGLGLWGLISGEDPFQTGQSAPVAGYQGGIPEYKLNRQQLPPPDPNRRPGSGGRRYFTDTQFTPKNELAQGGLASLGGKGYYLGGPTDGMADEVPATIDNKEPAKLSDGEFVIPADVVSHLGNGNSEAGARTLYEMMDRIRQARTGRKEQGRQIDPNKMLPR